MIEIFGVEFTISEFLFWLVVIIGMFIFFVVAQQAEDEQKYKVSRFIDRLNQKK
ncbi:hypothetical protein [Streptococcus sp. E17BB]|uniref:hypothetical protein n=1 Tax=Streptococcus sp. E17BB TaxID=3278714 RepID=UPI00359D003F